MGNLKKLPTSGSTVRTMTAPTARQNLLSRPDEDEEERWYKGNTPTASEMAARIMKIGKSDPTRGEGLWSAFSHYYQNDASSPIYNPYARATNSAIAGLSNLGVDVSGGINDEWFVNNAGLKNYYRVGAGGTPLAPSNGSSAEQDAGYYYYQLLNNEDKTKKAEAEWSALQEELAYWAGRKDRNYSDDEILSRIDWSNYPTLTDMDEGRTKGTPLKLNRAVGYSKDAMIGVLWAARNNGGSGDSFRDAISAALGEGNQWQADEAVSARLDPTNPAYNPYAAGSTIDDAALYFGVDSFNAGWLETNRALSVSKDATVRKYYEQVYKAEQTTAKLEEELQALNTEIERRSAYYDDPEMILNGLKDKYTTLKKMDESRASGDLLSTTRAIDYRWEDIEARVKEQCAAKADLTSGNTYVQGISDDLGFTTPSVESQDAIVGAQNTAISQAAGCVIASGTIEEKMVFEMARSADYDASIDRISDAILHGTTDAPSAYKIIRSSADTFAGKNYLRALHTTKTYEADAQRLESAKQELEALNASEDADAREVRRLESEINDLSVKLTNGQKAFTEAADVVAEVEDSYSTADRYAQMEGLEPDGSLSAKSLLDYVYQYGAQWERHDWTAQTLYDAAIADGYTYDSVAAAAKTGAEEIKQAIAEIDYVTEQMHSRGLVNVEAEEYMINMEHQRERLVRSLKDAEYFQLQGSEDFTSTVEDTKHKVTEAWDGAWFLTSMIKYGGYSKVAADIVSSINNPMGTDNMFVLQMTDVEKNTYLYLLGKDGNEAAQAYYDHLTDDEYGVLQTRAAQKEQAIYQELADEGFLGGAAVTALSVLGSPVQALGVGYSLYAYAKGEDINPHNQMFSGTRAVGAREDVKANITEHYGEGTLGAFLANLGYDAATSAADSMLAAAMGGTANAALALQSLGGAASSVQSTVLNGGSDAQALMMGGATALAEAVTEKLPMDQLFKLESFTPKNVKELAGYALASMGLEGVGEGLSDLISGLLETAIMDEQSSYEQLVDQYQIEDGVDEETARQRAMGDTIKGALYSALVGAVSGSATAVTAGAAKMQPQIQNDAVLGRKIAALSKVDAADASSVTATITAVLTPDVADKQSKALASTAAQHLAQKYGSVKVAHTLRGVLLTSKEGGYDANVVSTGLVLATLGEGESGVALDRIMQEGVTRENFGNLLTAAGEDMKNPEVGKRLQKSVTENQIAQRTKEIIADGGLSGVQSYEAANAQTQENLRVAKEKLQTATEECAAAGQNLQSVQAQWMAEPTNAALQGAVQQAVKDVEGKSVVMRQYEEGVQNFEAKAHEAEKMLATQREQALKGIREQAQQDVLAAQQQEAQAKQEAAATAEMERQYGNVEAMDAEIYIDQRHADATEDQRQQVRDEFAKTRADMPGNFQAGVEFASRLSKRFNVAIEVIDDADAQTEGWYNHETGTITINRGMSQGEIVKRVLLHELTHRAERGGEAYEQMAQALLDIRYGGDTTQMDADIASITNQYNDFFTRKGSQKRMSREEVVQELVANINAEILEGNQELIDRLIGEKPSLARRILDTIKQFLNRLRGVSDPEIDRLRSVEKLFEQALDAAETQVRSFDADGIQYSLREKEPPKNVVYAYKAFYARDGKLYPPMVANITDESDKQKVKNATSGTMKSLPTPVGVWLDADIGGILVDENGVPVRSKETKRLRVKNDKGGGKDSSLAFRPGWHLGEWPDAKQFNKTDPETGERGKRMPDDLVFAKCEVSADIDYQLDALSYGINSKGSFTRSQAGLPYVPDDGYYKYRTNVDPTTAPWLIAGSIKVVEILDDDDCARICAEFGVTPDKRYSGKKIDLSEYGLQRGPVEASVEGMEQFKENDANRANKKLLSQALADPQYPDAYVQREIDFDNPKQYNQLKSEFEMNGQNIEDYKQLYEERGFASERRATPAVTGDNGETIVGMLDDTAVQYSLRSWSDMERETVRTNLINKGHKAVDVERWISDVDSVARLIAADRDRLDFEAADNQVMLKPNQEYVKTLDASTLCAKRLLYQGTFNAIQHAMPDHIFTSEELLDLLNLMSSKGYETPCGICYVESRRRHLGKFAGEWLENYDAQGGYQPHLDDVTTTDGLERMRHEHPEVYKSFTDEMNRKGSNNPKVVQLRTDYRGDIRKLTRSQIKKIVDIGGLRVQSFSDFETPHLLDMMQAVMDMADMGLTSQAYTKVPNFAWVFGDTGIKINLSLIADGTGLDENGNLVFSRTEGIDPDQAMALRERYSQNVGTIIVGANRAHIEAAMADPRIDYIIPFHRSGWGTNELQKVEVLQTYEDFQNEQNERYVKGQTKGGSVTYSNVKENYHPVGPDGYWDFSKTGDENAEIYLRMCENDNRIPKFDSFLSKDANGHWVAPSGYWKMLIDFKMYDNNGVGAPQQVVQPDFNMDEAARVLNDYKGGANELPVAQDVVDQVVKDFGNVQFSLKQTEDGRKYVFVDTDQHIFDGHDPKEYPGIAKEYIKNRFRHTVIGDEQNRAFVDAKGEAHYVHPAKHLDDEAFASKMRAATELDNLMRAGVYVKNSGFERRHPEFPGGFDLYDTVFEVSGKLFQGRLNIGIDDRGRKRFYDMTKIKSLDPEVWVKQHNAAAHGAHQSSSGISISEEEQNVNRKYSLPSPNVLNRDIAAWRAGQNAAQPTDTEPSQQQPGGRERQFASQTLQNSQAMPDWLKADMMANADQRFYTPDSNNDQIMRSWERFQQEGYEGMRDRLLQRDAHLLTADDVADANTVMAWANRMGDAFTLLTMAQHYNVEGTREGQALQARKIFSRMTPAGARAFVAGQLERLLADHIQNNQQQREQIRKQSERVASRVRNRRGGDELLRMLNERNFRIDNTNNRWGIPINDQQQALIEEYELEDVQRPGIFYNRATTRQRMLEAILATPNPLELTGNGLNLIDRLEYMRRGEAVITNADLQYIGDNLSQFTYRFEGAEESRPASLALARAYEAFGNITPASLRDKARTWRYTSMLLSVPSAMRNVIGNAGQSVANATAHGIAVELDKIVSQFTRERTTAHLTAAERAQSWEAFVQETGNTFKDYFTDRAVTERTENSRFNTNQRGRVYQSQVLEAMRLTEGFLMSVGDRNFWRKAYINSIVEQMHLEDLNNTGYEYEDIRARAEADANYATFSEDGPVRRALEMLKRVPVVGDVLDFIMPFTGVPTNIVKRMWQFSPAGLASSAIRHAYRGLSGKDFLQRDFVNSMARGLTGTGLFVIGMALKEMGLIELGTGDEEDKKVYGVESAQGKQYSPYIRVGDEYVSLSPFAPAASPIIMGATAFDLFQNDDDTLTALYNSCLAGLDQIFDASYMSSLQDALQGYGSPSENIGTAILNGAVSQNVPSVLSQLATAMDDYVRDTKDKNVIMQALKSGLFQKLPWIREMLPEKVDVAGRSVTSKEGLRNFVDPFSTTEVIDDPALNELMRLHEALGDSSFMPSDLLSGTKTSLTGVSEEVTGKDKEVYKKRYGELWRLGGDTFDKDGVPVEITGVTELIQTEAYAAMTDEEKANAISGIVNDAKIGARYETAERLGSVVIKEGNEESYQKTAVRAMPAQFAQRNTPMLKKLDELYKRTGDGAFIPKSISSSFSVQKVQYDVTGENYTELCNIYAEKLEAKLFEIDWAASDEEVAASVNKAYTSAATQAKNAYAKLHGAK